jgi:hypothetical protein
MLTGALIVFGLIALALWATYDPNEKPRTPQQIAQHRAAVDEIIRKAREG